MFISKKDDANTEANKIFTPQITFNKTVLNFDEDINNIKLITPLQLLYLNTGESYPFADRLIEYLVGNAITPLDTLGDNIKRVKTTVVRQAGEDSGSHQRPQPLQSSGQQH